MRDLLLEHDLLLARSTPPREKLAQALELMEAGIRLKRAALRIAQPGATVEELEEAFERWLLADG
jgi:Rv0078B-related antitoxin